MATLEPSSTDFFVNPYNFVPLTKKVDRQQEKIGAKTGKIACTLLVKGKLALPDHENPCGELKNKYDFYSINDRPIIPGSELRGCIRSVFEAVTESCLSVINDNVLTGRLPRPDLRVKPGILEYDDTSFKWKLYPAEKRPKKATISKSDLPREWIVFGKSNTAKSYFYKTASKPINYDVNIDNFLELLDIYTENAKDDDKKDYSRFLGILDDIRDGIKNHKSLVVFFRQKGNSIDYLSPAQISRTRYNNTVDKLLKDHAPVCSKENGYCPACSLFGTLGNDSPLASRLRFSDAVPENVTIEKGYITLPELASPKITSVEFYSHKGNTYEYADQWTYDDAGVALNGRKFYFHSEPQSVDGEPNKRSLAVKPALTGSTFKFDVYFDGITEDELKKLLWVLTLGDNDKESRYQHKLGTGKPVGYGSVKIIVDKVSERTVDNGYACKEQDYTKYEVSDSIFSETDAVKAVKRISNSELMQGKKVSYPIADDGKGTANSTASHQWFSSNRTQGNKNNAAKFKYVLPAIGAVDLSRPAMYTQGRIVKDINKKSSQPQMKTPDAPKEKLVAGHTYFGKTAPHNNKKKIRIILDNKNVGVANASDFKSISGLDYAGGTHRVSVVFERYDSENNRNVFKLKSVES